MKKIKLFIISILIILNSSTLIADDFNNWKIKFKKRAIIEGISKSTVNNLIDKTKFLPDVIKYDRYQPEFYEDTKTYVDKRASDEKLRKGLSLYKKVKKLIKKNPIKYPNGIDPESFKKIFASGLFKIKNESKKGNNNVAR